MIKINLLNSVTERQAGAVVAVERKIGSPVSRLLLMSISVGVLLASIIAWDIISTQMARTKAETELADQKKIEAELATVLKEQKDLEAKIQNIDKRIEAIKKLRATQAGPSAVLEALRERITMTPGLYLESVSQQGEQLEIKGNSPDEQAVTQFGRSLEFSSGLFSNLSIETQRKEEQNQQVTPNPQQPEAGKLVLVGFTIRCAYTPAKASGNNNSSPTTASVMPPPQQPQTPSSQQKIVEPPPPNPQIAKK